MANQAVLVLSGLALLTFFVRGAVGAGNSVVFNASFIVVYALEMTGGLDLRDGLYWLALANAVGAIVMLSTLRRTLELEPFVLRYLAGSLPVSIAFSIVLTRVEGEWLAVALALVVAFAGVRMAYRRHAPPAPVASLERWAFPVGLASGVLGGLYGMGGPIGLLLFNRAPGDPTRFRMRLTVVTSSIGLVRVTTLATQGVFTTPRLLEAAATLPAVGVGLAAGFWAHRFLKPAPLRLGLGVLVAMSGALALVEVATG